MGGAVRLSYTASDFQVHEPGDVVSLPCGCSVTQTKRHAEICGHITTVRCKPHGQSVLEAVRRRLWKGSHHVPR